MYLTIYHNNLTSTTLNMRDSSYLVCYAGHAKTQLHTLAVAVCLLCKEQVHTHITPTAREKVFLATPKAMEELDAPGRTDIINHTITRKLVIC